MQISNANGSDFKVVSDFLLQNHDKAYKAPKKAKNAEEKMEMEYLYKAGKNSKSIFSEKMDLLAAENGLYVVINKSFLDGSLKRIRNYYWGQLKLPEYYFYPESISVFCEVIDNEDVRFRVSLEINEKKADEKDIEVFLRALDKPLKKELCYIGNLKFNRSLTLLSLNKNEIKEKLSKGVYNKVQVTYLIKKYKNDEDLLKELNKGIRLLLPYYKYILSLA
jgi:hypothetical protein